MPAVLPTFFIVGAAKCGTTSLNAYLGAHPDIAMSTLKEPSIFERTDWEQQLPAYNVLFPDRSPVRGESSTAYSAFPWAPEVADRIVATVPDARIVYLVRDPLARFRSHYAQNVFDGLPVSSVDAILDDAFNPLHASVHCSRYATQLQRWVSRVGEGRVLVLEHRRLRDERADTVRRVFRFLGVADDVVPDAAWAVEHNRTTQHRRLKPVTPPPLLGRRQLSKRVRRWRFAHVEPPLLTSQQEQRLREIFAPEAAKLRQMTGLALDDWSV